MNSHGDVRTLQNACTWCKDTNVSAKDNSYSGSIKKVIIIGAAEKPGLRLVTQVLQGIACSHMQLLSMPADSPHDKPVGIHGPTCQKGILHSTMFSFHVCCIGKEKSPSGPGIKRILGQGSDPYLGILQLAPLRPEEVGNAIHKWDINPSETMAGCHRCGGCSPIQEAYDWAASRA